MTNTSKLRGRIAEKGYTMGSFSKAVGISRPSLRMKLSGEREFKASEITKSCLVLEISRHDIGEYFFAPNVPVLETSN